MIDNTIGSLAETASMKDEKYSQTPILRGIQAKGIENHKTGNAHTRAYAQLSKNP